MSFTLPLTDERANELLDALRENAPRLHSYVSSNLIVDSPGGNSALGSLVACCARQVSHGSASLAGSLRNLKAMLVSNRCSDKSRLDALLDKLSQQDCQAIMFRDILQFSSFDGTFPRLCIDQLTRVSSILDSARMMLTNEADESVKWDESIRLLNSATDVLDSLTNDATRLMFTHGTELESAGDVLSRILQRFSRCIRPLQERRKGKAPYKCEDEYDVQDLLLGLLRLHFDDVRPEEWTPSYAGTGSRMDFLLKKERIVIEVKKTRKDLLDKAIVDELIVDIQRYRTHEDCKKLVCFIYDPDRLLAYPDALQADINNTLDSLEVELHIST